MEEFLVLRRRPAPSIVYLGASGGTGPTVLTAQIEDGGALKKDPSIVAAAPPMPVCLVHPVERDAATTSVAWGVRAVRASTSALDGSRAKVAILDTGIDAGHAAFAGIAIESRDFTGQGAGDADGHGTHCAGTVFGRDVNGVRIGVARGVQQAVIGKVIGTAGGATPQLLDAILWAVERGAHVISMSIGIDFPAYQQRLVASGFPPDVATSKALDAYRENVLLFERLAAMIKAGAYLGRTSLLIAAAGNESRRDRDPRFSVGCGPPAVSDGFISVAGVEENGGQWRAAPFSNINATVAAPGVDVLSARLGGGLVAMSGTSMAAPHVAGVAALLAQKHLQSGGFRPELAAAQLMALATVQGMAPGFTTATVGAGLVQALQS